jgi:hypothetical protein
MLSTFIRLYSHCHHLPQNSSRLVKTEALSPSCANSPLPAPWTDLSGDTTSTLLPRTSHFHFAPDPANSRAGPSYPPPSPSMRMGEKLPLPRLPCVLAGGEKLQEGGQIQCTHTASDSQEPTSRLSPQFHDWQWSVVGLKVPKQDHGYPGNGQIGRQLLNMYHTHLPVYSRW